MKTNRVPISRSLLLRLAAEGIEAAEVLARAGLPRDLLDSAPILVSTRQLFCLWEAIGECGASAPGVALRIGAASKAAECDISALAALYSANLRDALTKLARYKRLVSPEQIDLVPAQESLAMTFTWTLAAGPTPPTLVDAICASALALARRGTGRSVVPQRIELARRPADEVLLREHFGCSIVFDSPRDRVLFHRADAVAEFVTRDDDALAALLPALRSRAVPSDAIDQRVANAMLTEMRGLPLRIEQTAKAFNVSARTLQRRLRSAGTSYQSLLARTRSHAAFTLLHATDLEIGEIAFLLGYEELNSFYRAFRSWSDASPSHWRAITTGRIRPEQAELDIAAATTASAAIVS